MEQPKYCESNYWLQTIILSNKFKKFKNGIISNCHKNGIRARPLWDLISSYKMYKNNPKMKLDNSQNLYERVINLPSSSNLLK